MESENIINLKQVDFLGVYYNFFHELISKLIIQIGFDTIKSSLLLDLVIIRMMAPASKSRSIALLEEYFGIKHRRLELNRLVDKEKEIVSKLAEIPDQVNIRHHYGIDLKSTPVIIVMILLSVITSLGLGVLFEKDKQIVQKTSYEYRYRMIGLDFPKLRQKIDSAFNKDASRFKQIVTKREEELRLINSIEQKRSEIQRLGD